MKDCHSLRYILNFSKIAINGQPFENKRNSFLGTNVMLRIWNDKDLTFDYIHKITKHTFICLYLR